MPLTGIATHVIRQRGNILPRARIFSRTKLEKRSIEEVHKCQQQWSVIIRVSSFDGTEIGTPRPGKWHNALDSLSRGRLVGVYQAP